MVYVIKSQVQYDYFLRKEREVGLMLSYPPPQSYLMRASNGVDEELIRPYAQVHHIATPRVQHFPALGLGVSVKKLRVTPWVISYLFNHEPGGNRQDEDNNRRYCLDFATSMAEKQTRLLWIPGRHPQDVSWTRTRCHLSGPPRQFFLS